MLSARYKKESISFIFFFFSKSRDFWMVGSIVYDYGITGYQNDASEKWYGRESPIHLSNFFSMFPVSDL